MSAFCDHDYLQALLDVEVALAAAEAESGLIPPSAAVDIKAAACAELFDLSAITQDAINDGNVVIPLVRKLTEAVSAKSPESSRYVHRGATSQDIMDTAQALLLRKRHAVVREELTRAMESAAALARAHAATPMAGRTWLQHASPTTFGLKAAAWLDMLGRCRARLEDSVARAQVLQLGGASGTLASLGPDGPAVAEAMAKALALRVPPAPWHTHRDRVAEAASAFSITCGALGKIGRDLTLLAQSEVAEVQTASGGGSSSMPHKQNPVRAVTAVAAAIRAPGMMSTLLSAMVQEHERAAGGWQAEWQTLRDLIDITIDAARAIAAALGELKVDPSAMRRHLDSRGGVAMAEALSIALQPHLGRKQAMAHVEQLVRKAETEGQSLRTAAVADREVARVLSQQEIDRALAPESFLGSTGVFVERVLREWKM